MSPQQIPLEMFSWWWYCLSQNLVAVSPRVFYRLTQALWKCVSSLSRVAALYRTWPSIVDTHASHLGTSRFHISSLGPDMCVNPLKPELNPIFYLLALLGAHHFLHFSRIRIKSLTFRRLMSYIYIYIYGAPILDVSRSHTTTQHSR